jgi:hypothetical protein
MIRKFFKEYDQDTLDFLKHHLSKYIILLHAELHVKEKYSNEDTTELRMEYNRLKKEFHYINEYQSVKWLPSVSFIQ